MAYTPSHHKEVENLVGAEVLVLTMERLEFQGIDDTADGVNDAAPKEP